VPTRTTVRAEETEAGVCHYCGCRDIPLIKEFIAEHEVITEAAETILRYLEREQPERVQEVVERIFGELASHFAGEEDGLFAVMHPDPEYTDYIDDLVAEHRALTALLREADPACAADRERLAAAMNDIHRHIAKEEEGLFPVSLSALTGEQWNTSMHAWQVAHPGRTPSWDTGVEA